MTKIGTAALDLARGKNTDQENMAQIWQMVMPPPAFDQAKQLIQRVNSKSDTCPFVSAAVLTKVTVSLNIGFTIILFICTDFTYCP